MEMPQGVNRSAVVWNKENGLSLRGMEAVVPELRNGKVVDWCPLLRLDMTYGVA